MPEEMNRVLTDHVSDLFFCPTETAVKNLEQEGISHGVHLVGDVMYDSVLQNVQLARKRSRILEKLRLRPKDYGLATVHRSENTDDPDRLCSIFGGLDRIAQDGLPIIVPLHPRTRKHLESMTCPVNNLKLIEPVSYLNMLRLEEQAKVIFTDSGGVQKEACWLGIPCITLREETEWVETVASGWNVLAGCDPDRIVEAAYRPRPDEGQTLLYGDGNAAKRIVQCLADARTGNLKRLVPWSA